MNTNYYDYMTVKELSDILSKLPDDMKIVIPVIDEEDVNYILGFRKIRTAGVLRCESEQDNEVLCINGATDGYDIDDQIRFSGKEVDVVRVLYGKEKTDATYSDQNL
jgi:hypothetical protein